MFQTRVSEILIENVGVECSTSKCGPRLLSQEQKEFLAEVAQQLLDMANSSPDCITKVITGDELRFYDYDPARKAQSSSHGRKL